jgi:hypothetical protein
MNDTIKRYFATIEVNISYIMKKYDINTFLIKSLSKKLSENRDDIIFQHCSILDNDSLKQQNATHFSRLVREPTRLSNKSDIEIKIKFKNNIVLNKYSIKHINEDDAWAKLLFSLSCHSVHKVQDLMTELTVITGININTSALIDKNTFWLLGKGRIDYVPNYKVPKAPGEIEKEVNNFMEYVIKQLL